MGMYTLNTSYKSICEDMTIPFSEIKRPYTKDEIEEYSKRIQSEFAEEIQYAKDHKGVINENVSEDDIELDENGEVIIEISDFEQAMINLNSARARYRMPWLNEDFTEDYDNDWEDD